MQVGVVGLDLDIGMKLSMRRIPYEGELFVRQQALLITRSSCTPARDTAVQPFKHLSAMIILKAVGHL